MNWVRGDDYHIKSVPPGYTITRLYSKDDVSYEVWRGRMHVSTHKDPDEARASAARHSERFDAGAPA